MKKSVLPWVVLFGFVVLILVGWYVLYPTEENFVSTVPAPGEISLVDTDTYRNEDSEYSPYDEKNATMTDAGISAGRMTPAPVSSTVVLSAGGFSPSTVTIAKGEKVTWTSSEGNMWVASAGHPTHTVYDGTSEADHCAPNYAGPIPFDQCASGTSYSFTFDKVGTWKYHNHANSAQFGTVIVQ